VSFLSFEARRDRNIYWTDSIGFSLILSARNARARARARISRETRPRKCADEIARDRESASNIGEYIVCRPRPDANGTPACFPPSSMAYKRVDQGEEKRRKKGASSQRRLNES